MLITATLSPEDKVTPEMIQEIEAAKKIPITYDEDCPELSERQLKQFECMLRMRDRLIKKFDSDCLMGAEPMNKV